MAKHGPFNVVMAALAATCAFALACAPAPPPAATVAPAKPEPARAAEPAAAKAEKAAPAAAAPTAAPAAKPAAFDERAVADFYRGKTIRIMLGLPPGSGADVTARMVARHLSRYVPGNPSVVVDNKPGAGGLLAGNLVYNVEPKDGTVIVGIIEGNVLQQALGAPGIEFDVTKFNWLGSLIRTHSACLARTDSGVNSIQEMISGKELIVASTGPGTTSYDTPTILKEALGANFKLVSGYEGGAKTNLAIETKEVDGYCVSLNAMLSTMTNLLGGEQPTTKIIVIMGSETPDHPLLKGVPAAETLAKTEDAKLLLRAVAAPGQMTRPFAFAPGVPSDRVEALRQAFAQVFVDPQFLEDGAKAKVDLSPSTGQEVTRIVQGIQNTPPAVIEKLKLVLK